MTNLPIKAFTGTINNQTVQLINVRDLHKVLRVKTRFDIWISRRLLNGYFRENLDFIECSNLSNRGFFKTEVKDYHLTIDTAKHLCLMEHSEIGYKIRQQFIDDDNKMRALIPQLTAELAEAKQQLISIPTFLRQNPNHAYRLAEQAKTAFLRIHPKAKALQRYREMGLNTAEIATLLELSVHQVKRLITQMIKLGFFDAKNGNQYTTKQLSLLV
ncbi:antA/AntB antirepressor family protein [Gallibacterium sp. AGMB14963]|uniref:antA/AntB antirepressor family protein n=1 Tax=Gallibacterium faecale TaxID=3019086 RepID=UPI0022F1DD96|nr:antA/AntB antirepressor family protein [Gallibacterium sp. AGMB14963]MDA3978464.1 antA/AntB antirepressor family protein [Gallibacterium sp. AGMB14963]